MAGPLVRLRGGRMARTAGATVAALTLAASALGCSMNVNVASPTGSQASSAPTGSGGLRPPAAPTDAQEWIVEGGSSGTVPAYFRWTPPSGPISGYYFTVAVVSAGDASPAPLVCGPTWDTLPSGADSYVMPSIQSGPPEAYICAYNDAGTSPTVKFQVVASPAS